MAAPKFRESFMCTLTTATTCYSAPREVSEVQVLEESCAAFLATENHVLDINLNVKSFEEGTAQQVGEDSVVSFVEHSIPIPSGIPRRIAKKLICVGYDHREGWEAIVLLDTSQSQRETSDDDPLSQQQQDDDRTIATADGQSRQPHRRRVSSGNVSVASSTDGTASMSSATSASSAPAVVSSNTDNTNANRGGSGIGSAPKLANLQEEGENDEEGEEEHVQPVARMVLQHRATRRRFIQALYFRPLSPCISILNHSQDSSMMIAGVWVGSSDDSKLRFFRNDTVSSGVLMEVPLDATNDSNNDDKDNSATTFQTPVMTVDSLSLPRRDADPFSEAEEKMESTDDSKGVVAVACQDGTVRFIGFEWLVDDSSNCLKCHIEYTVVVDGPIVCLQLVEKRGEQKLEAVIGSLCGYVARFEKKSEQWEGPLMVSEGFRSFQSQEDSVLAVHSWDEKVALGTYSGRCLLYGRQDGSNDEGDDHHESSPFWDCQLPDPIHGICHIPTKSSTCCLLVTTRRSIHIFQEVPKLYQPDVAKRKLELLWSSRQEQTNAAAATDTTEPNPNETTEEETKEETPTTEEPATSPPAIDSVATEAETSSETAKPH